MKKTLLYLLLAMPMAVFSQKNASLEVTSGLNFTDFTHNISSTKGRLNYDFGLAMTLPMKNSQRELVLGLRFMGYGDKYSKYDLRWGTQHDGQGGFDPNAPSLETVEGIKSKSSYYYFELPVGIRQYLTSGNTKLFLQATAGPSYFISGRNQNTFGFNNGSSQTGVDADNSLNIRPLNFMAGVGLGLEIPVSAKLRVQCQAHGQTQVLDIVNNSYSHAKWYAFGIRAGLRYRLF